MEHAADAAVLDPPIAHIRAAMRAMPGDEAKLACRRVPEQRKVLPKQADGNDRAVRLQFPC